MERIERIELLQSLKLVEQKSNVPFSMRKQLRLPQFVGSVTLSEWACYLHAVYGERIRLNANERLDIQQFQILYIKQLKLCGVNLSDYSLPRAIHRRKGCCIPPGTIQLNGPRPGHVHKTYASRKWIEITHCTRGLTEAGYWMYALRGSGVFVNVGRTIVFDRHGDALRKVVAPRGICQSKGCADHRVGGKDSFWKTMHPLCATLRANGYNSVQFRRSEWSPLPMELFLTDLSGTHTCGPTLGLVHANLTLRSGYRATRPLTCNPHERCTHPFPKYTSISTLRSSSYTPTS